MTTTEEAHTLSNLTSLYQESANEQINLLLHYHENNENEAIASLLDTLVEGRFHQETNATIRSPSHINVLLFGLLPRLNPSLQPKLVDTFANMVHRHLRNAETCRRGNLTQHLVSLLSTMDISAELRTSFVGLLQAIGSHSTTINDVYVLFRPIVTLHDDARPSGGSGGSGGNGGGDDGGDGGNGETKKKSTERKEEKARPEVALLLLRAMEAMANQSQEQHQDQEHGFFDLDPHAPTPVERKRNIVSFNKLTSPIKRRGSGGGSSGGGSGWSRPVRPAGLSVPASSLQVWPAGGYTLFLSIRPETLDPNSSHLLFSFRGMNGHGITCMLIFFFYFFYFWSFF